MFQVTGNLKPLPFMPRMSSMVYSDGEKQGGVMSLKILMKIVIVVLLVVCLEAGVACSAEKRTHVTVQIVPCCDVITTFKKFHPLMIYLQESTGFDVEMVTPKDYSEFEWAVKNQEIDFVFQDPHTYVALSKFLDRKSLLSALAWDGKQTQSGLVIARKDSGIRRIEDLRGRNVMFGPKLSVAKWVAAKELLSEHGIDIDDNLRSYRNGGCCEDIAFNVYLKAVDAGVICDHFLEQHPDKQNELGIDVRQLTVIGKTKPVPTRVLAARRQLDQRITAKINQALLRLDKRNPAHAKILASAELGGFQKSKDADYDSIRLRLGMKRSSAESRR